jgi:hypothetical protein
MDHDLAPLPGDAYPDDEIAGALLRPDGTRARSELAAVLLEMQELGRVPAPEPSPELRSLLTKGLPNIRRKRARRRNVVVGATLVSAMTVGVTGIAAANDSLPGGSRGVVAGVINNLTPFHVHDRRSRPVEPSGPGSVPASDEGQTSRPGRITHPEEGSVPGLERDSDGGAPGDDGTAQATAPGAVEDGVPTPTPAQQDTGWRRPSWPRWGTREREGDDRERSSTRSPTPTATQTPTPTPHPGD